MAKVKRLLSSKSAVGSRTSEEYFTALKKGGYATDPKYVNSGVNTANGIKQAIIIDDSKTKSPQPSSASPNDVLRKDKSRKKLVATASPSNSINVPVVSIPNVQYTIPDVVVAQALPKLSLLN